MIDNSHGTSTSAGRWSALSRLLARAAPADSGFESSRALAKWLALGLIIGVAAGAGAILFSRGIELATDFFLGDLVGYLPPSPIGEGEPIRRSMERPWALPLVTTLGGLLSGIIVYRFAPEASGHGTDAAIEAIHHKGGRLRARIPPIKLITSAITIGSGGSAGREGPAAQISAGVGSLLGERLKLNARDRRIAVAAGMGAGIGAIFRAPLGGALMAAEILYIHDLEVEALIPALIASIVGYSIYGMVEGWDPIFGAQPSIGFDDPVTLVYYAVLGLVCGAVGLLYARGFYGIEGVFHRIKAPAWIKPAIGGLLVGLIGLKIGGAVHTGYGWVQISMSDELMSLPLWIVIVLPFAKILTTSFSIGSGGSGGIFGPGMVIGGMLGAAFWRLGDGTLPHLPDSPAPFVIIGMMALFGGIAHAPLAVMLMVAEMTGNLSLLAPAMVAVALSTALVGDTTIYKSQLPDRSHSPAHRNRFSFPLLSSLFARDAMQPTAATGVADGVRISADLPLDDALATLTDAGAASAAVTEDARVVGTLSPRDIITTYRAALQQVVRRTQGMPSGSSMLEFRLPANSPLAGKRLRDAGFPGDSLVVSISRHGEPIFPRPDTELQAGDLLGVLTRKEREMAIRSFLGEPAAAPR